MEGIKLFFRTMFLLDGFQGFIVKIFLAAWLLTTTQYHVFVRESSIMFLLTLVCSYIILMLINKKMNKIEKYSNELKYPDKEDYFGAKFEDYYWHAEQIAIMADNIFNYLMGTILIVFFVVKFNLDGYYLLYDLSMFLYLGIFASFMSIDRLSLAMKYNFDLNELEE